MLIIASVEALPRDLDNVADYITIFFPWGTLLEGIVKPLPEIIQNIVRIGKDSATFTIVTTYTSTYEESEINKRKLPEINMMYFHGDYKHTMNYYGMHIETIQELNSEQAKEVGSQWAKRLSSGRFRNYYKIEGTLRR